MKKYKLMQWYPSLPCEWEIGDKVERWLNYDRYHVPCKQETIPKDEVENNPDFWELIEEKESKPLFTTDDGVQMLDRDSIVWMVRNNTLEKIKIHSIHLNEYDFEHKVFAHESNADEYIWKNKRVFSYEDFIKWGNVPYQRVIEQLAKERI